MLIVEFRIDSPILRDAVSSVPGLAVVVEQLYVTEDDEIRLLFWAEDGDYAAFEAALDADPTATNRKVLAATESRRLYRVDLTEYGRQRTAYPGWGDLDIVPLHLHLDDDEWDARMQIPDRETLARYRKRCEELGLSFELESIYEVADGPGEGADATLSSSQREAIEIALEAGYFEVPREATLAEVADELDISSQALSERLRRGMRALAERAVQADDGE